ncbi:MAG TPA: hypothetical protein DEP42_04610 [Ruminococcaceae bacterium]|nr:hypothetical protein [Oscillospiraceae bacterium]
MAILLKKTTLHTDSFGFTPITQAVQAFVTQSGIKEGICVIFSPHTTAGITINENADPDVKTDLSYAMNCIFPKLPGYRHLEGNSDAHVKSTVTGASETVIIHDGRLLLGRWQALYFCEYDGPRVRTFYTKILEG